MASSVKKPQEVLDLEAKCKAYNALPYRNSATFIDFAKKNFGFKNLEFYRGGYYNGAEKYINLSEFEISTYTLDNGFVDDFSCGCYNVKNVHTSSKNTFNTLLVDLKWGECEINKFYPLVYIDKELNAWECQVKNAGEKLSTWRRCNRLKLASFIQDKVELDNLINQTNPYLAGWAGGNGVDVRTALLAPQLELLDKAGYKFINSVLRFRFHCENLFETYNDVNSNKGIILFNRLCQPGKNPKEIFKTSKNVYSLLKDEENIERWDIFRKFDKLRKLDKDTLKLCYESDISETQLNNIYCILGKEYQGKPVFNFQNLINYLNRIDMYEAIDRDEGLKLLDDYLGMCNQLNMKPRIDGDSLKREHDIAARNVRNKKDEIMKEKMEHIKETAHNFDYAEKNFYVKAVTDYDELLDEANQQHNCVASYADRIAKNKTRIWVARECNNPDVSVATLEPASDFREYRQKLLAYNKPIRNKALTEFLDRSLQHARDVEAGKVEPMKIAVVDGRMQEINAEAPVMEAAPVETVRDWYVKEFPTDECGPELNDTITFDDINEALDKGKDIYKVMGVYDSLVRERVFSELADKNNVDYGAIFDKWLDSGKKNSYIDVVPVEPTVDSKAVMSLEDGTPVVFKEDKPEIIVEPPEDVKGFGRETDEPKVQMSFDDFNNTVENVEIITTNNNELAETNTEVMNCLQGCIAFGEHEDPAKIQAVLDDIKGRTYLPQDMNELGEELAAKYGLVFNGCSIDDNAKETVFNMLDRGEQVEAQVNFAAPIVNNNGIEGNANTPQLEQSQTNRAMDRAKSVSEAEHSDSSQSRELTGVR